MGQNEPLVKKTIVYIVPFDVYTRLLLDSNAIKSYPGVKRRIIENKAAVKILNQINASVEFEAAKCDLDLRIFCEMEFDDRNFKNISIGSTRHANARGKCYLPSKRLIKYLKHR